MSEWFHVEFFVHRGDADGRTWLEVNRETVWDYTGDNIDAAPINRIFLARSHGSAPFEIQVDGIEIWDAVPAAGDTSKPAPTPTNWASGAASDTIALRGNRGNGGHTLTVEFLNDAHGDTADEDHSLYVDVESYGGDPVADGTAARYANGHIDFAS